MTERIPNMLARLDSLERHSQRLETLWQNSVEEIKDTIKTEIRDLKDEPIADLKAAYRALTDRLDAVVVRVEKIELRQAKWDSGASIIDWLIKLAIGGAGLLAGIFGAQHLKS